MPDKNWQTIHSETVAKYRGIEVIQQTVKLPDGRQLDDYFLFKVSNAAIVVAITKEGNVIMVRQYKHGAGQVVTEFPAGMIDKEEEPIDAANRELREETGFTSPEVRFIQEVFYHSTKSPSRMNVFVALNCEKTDEVEFDENEDIEILEITKAELWGMVRNCQIQTGNVLAAITLAYDYLKEN